MDIDKKVETNGKNSGLKNSLIKEIPSKPRSLYPLMAIVVLSLVAIEIPYRAIHVPQPIMVTFGILSFIGISFLAFENYFMAMLILVSYIPFSSILPGDFGGFLTAFNLTNILSIIIIAGWIAKGAFKNQKLYTKTSVDWWLFFFCVLSSLSLIQGSIMGTLEEGILFSLKRYLTPFFFFYVFSNNITKRKESEYIYVAVAFATFCAAFMALKESYMDIGSFGSWDSMRVGGITKQPNDLAAYFSYYSPFILVPFLYNTNKYRYWLLPFGAFICFWATTRTFSRGGMLAFVITILITISFNYRKIAIFASIVIIIIVTYFPHILPESIIGRFSETYRDVPQQRMNMSHLPGQSSGEFVDPERLDASASRRLRIWGDSIPHIIRNPIFGIGYGKFARVMRGDAHNGFILICGEMGIPALIIYLVILWKLGRSARYVSKYSPHPILKYSGQAYLCSIIAVVIANQFGSRLNSQELSSLFWIMGGIIMYVSSEMKNRTSEEFPTTEPLPQKPAKISGIIRKNTEEINGVPDKIN